MKVSQQCALAAKKCNSLLGGMNRSTASKAREVTVPLSSALIRLYLEHCVQVWPPQSKKDIDKAEQVQQRVTKAMRGLEHSPCEERLRDLTWFSLEKGRLWEDPVETVQYGELMQNVGRLFPVVRDGRVRHNGCRLK